MSNASAFFINLILLMFNFYKNKIYFFCVINITFRTDQLEEVAFKNLTSIVMLHY